MSDIDVDIIHPIDGRSESVTLDPSLTAQEVIDLLIQHNFIPPNPHGYQIAIKGGPILPVRQTLFASGVKAQATLRVVPATDAGWPLFF